MSDLCRRVDLPCATRALKATAAQLSRGIGKH
jgi:hypothetical protein